jgi:rubrerythrin
VTKTLKNLCQAYAGESQARNRYSFYASVAKKEDYQQISAIFKETSEQEKEHAEQLFDMIIELAGKEGINNLEIDKVDIPFGLGKTLENLKDAIKGETHEFTSMYPDFAKIAKEEGFAKIAVKLNNIAKAEKHHRDRYLKLKEQLENDTFFKKDEEVTWICRECGYRHVGKMPPKICPVCSHSQGYYQLECEKY